MSEDEQHGLRRFDIRNNLPAGFHELTKEEQLNVLKKLQEQDIELRAEWLRKIGKSEVAEHDLSVGISVVQRLDHERKIYSHHQKGETGSGTYDLNIKGGDTKFIVPVLVVIGVIILGIILIIAIK
ncbi:MAG: hypothetical protein AB1611_03405 [bacterium]